MSGLLDPKTRVIDAVLTPEGRRQMLMGGINIKFASFSDINGTYDFDSRGVFIENNANINLEASSNRNDEIFQVTDEGGKLKEYAIYDNVSEATAETYSSLDTDKFLSHKISYDYMSTVIESLKNQCIISTVDKSRDDTGLDVTPSTLDFKIIPFERSPDESSITDVDSLFQDKRLSTVPNFLYLPPVQRGNGNSPQIKFGEYANFSEENDIGTSNFIEDLKKLENQELRLSKFTKNNDLLIQIYESKSGKNIKLDVIYYGKISMGQELKDLYFAGKLYFDGFEIPTFVNIFTLVI